MQMSPQMRTIIGIFVLLLILISLGSNSYAFWIVFLVGLGGYFLFQNTTRIESLEQRVDHQAALLRQLVDNSLDFPPKSLPSRTMPERIPQQPFVSASAAVSTQVPDTPPRPLPPRPVLTQTFAPPQHYNSISHTTPPPMSHNTQPTTQNPDWFISFSSWIAKDWLMKVGALFVLFSIIWLMSIGYTSKVIPQWTLLLIGGLFSVAFQYLGYREIKKMPIFAQVMVATGIAIGGITIAAGNQNFAINALNTTVASFALVLANVIISIRTNARYIATYSAVILYGVIAWTANQFGSTFAAIMLFGANLMAISIVFIKGWRELVTTSLVASWLFTSISFSGEFPVWVNVVLTVLYFAATIVSWAREKEFAPLDIFNSVAVSLLSIFWLSRVGDTNIMALVYSVFGTLSLLAAFWMRKLHPQDERYYLQFVTFGVSNIISLVLWRDQLNIVAVPVLATQLFAAYYVAKNIWKDKVLAQALIYLQYIPMTVAALFVTVLVYNTTTNYNFNLASVINPVYLFPSALILSITMALQSYQLLHEKRKDGFSNVMIWFSEILGILAFYTSAYSFLTLVINADVIVVKAVMYILFTVGGLGALTYQQKNGGIRAGFYGWALLAMVLANLLLIDFRVMPDYLKIITFMVVGLLFISSSYIFKLGKKKL